MPFSGCSVGYNLSSYLQHHELNSQVAEQRNSTLKRLKAMLSYMSMSHFMDHCRLFVWGRNMLTIASMKTNKCNSKKEDEQIKFFRLLAPVFSRK